MSGKVGTELAKLIPEWAVQSGKQCKCKDMQAKMDKWGPEGCYDRRNVIVAHLMAQSEVLIPAFKLIPASVRKITAAKLLKKAITNSQK
jgi:hypothetical protein